MNRTARPRSGALRRLLAATAAVVTGAMLAAGPALAAPAPRAQAADPSLGTAEATAGQVDLDLRLLDGLLGSLHLSGPNGLDVPLANLVLGHAAAPTAAGNAANFSNSVLRLRDDLLNQLHLPAQSADLLKADVASGTARVLTGPGAYTQAYATVANLRLFLPLLVLPGADAANGVLKIDAVSAQATCVPGQAPQVSAKMPTTIQVLGRQIKVPLTGDVPLDLGVAKVDVHLSPVTSSDSGGGSAAVEARISVDAVGLAKVSGAIVLASAKCTAPAGGGSTAGVSGGASAGSVGGVVPVGAAVADRSGPLAETGASPMILPLAGLAVVAVVGGGALVWLKRRGARGPE